MSAHRNSIVLLTQFPLQTLLRKHAHWRGAPVVVVDDEGPNGRITHLNQHAKRERLRVGMRQAAALGLVPTLHTAVVPAEVIHETSEDILRSLQTFSPRVESESRFLGAFSIDSEGLRRLYGGDRIWATSIHRYLRARKWRASIVVGFHRYRALAVASSSYDARVLKSPEEEKSLSDATSLEYFDLPARLCEQLGALGICTLGAFLSVPAGELKSRFGQSASQLHDLFNDDFQLPIQPFVFEDAPSVSFQIDPPDHDQHRLLFAIKGALHSLLAQIRARGESLKSLQIDFHLEQKPKHRQSLEPAAPTLDLMQIVELIRLRLSALKLEGDVEEIVLTAMTDRTMHEQTLLKGHEPKRDLRAASQALAKVRAAYGTHSVSTATLRDAHLPEASFRWDPVSTVKLPEASTRNPSPHATPLVRRVFSRPKPLPSRTPRQPECGPRLTDGHDIEHLYGPYRVSGGWWKRLVERDYYYAQTDVGDLLWLFYDRPRQRWFLHGIVD